MLHFRRGVAAGAVYNQITGLPKKMSCICSGKAGENGKTTTAHYELLFLIALVEKSASVAYETGTQNYENCGKCKKNTNRKKRKNMKMKRGNAWLSMEILSTEKREKNRLKEKKAEVLSPGDDD